MRRREGRIAILSSIAVVIILVITVSLTISSVNKRMKQYCYEELERTSKSLATELYATIHSDRTMLIALSEIIARDEEMNDQELCDVMNSINRMDSYITYLGVLTPDNMLLQENGNKIATKGALDFQTEAKKGAYVSDKEQGIIDPNDVVVRNVVPVVKDGKTVAMLYGVVSLTQLADLYKTDIYDNEAYVYLVDGDTGDFMLDTWHKSLGNISDFDKRKLVDGYSFEDMKKDLKIRKGGNLCFVSKTTGGILYLHYEPTGVNNWSVLVTVEEKAAFRDMESISVELYVMAAVIGVVLLIYMGSIVWCLMRAYEKMHRMDTEDKTTSLQNRNAYDTYVEQVKEKNFPEITCIYADANGLHEINNKYGHIVGDHLLRTVANAFLEQFPYKMLYRIGGDEFVVLTEELSVEACQEKLEQVVKNVEAHDYSISVGVATKKNEEGVDRVINEADEKMLENKRIYYQSHSRRKISED